MQPASSILLTLACLAGSAFGLLPCPKYCRCDETNSTYGTLFTISCDDAQVDSIPDLSALSTADKIEMYIARASIDQLAPGDFKAPDRLHYDTIELDSCAGLADIGDNTFAGLTTLSTLTVMSSALSRIGKRTYAGLTGLSMLRLDHNQIKSVDKDAFASLPSLVRLLLFDNYLGRISAATFGNALRQLQVLNVGKNQLAAVEANSLRSLSSLKELTFVDNQLTQLQRTTLAGLAKLTNLVFARNRIQTIEPGAFGDLASVVNLQLQDNELTALPSGTFDGLAKLKMLFLQRNRLNATVIDWNVFRATTSLITLDLRGNNVTAANVPDWLKKQVPNILTGPAVKPLRPHVIRT